MLYLGFKDTNGTLVKLYLDNQDDMVTLSDNLGALVNITDKTLYSTMTLGSDASKVMSYVLLQKFKNALRFDATVGSAYAADIMDIKIANSLNMAITMYVLSLSQQDKMYVDAEEAINLIKSKAPEFVNFITPNSAGDTSTEDTLFELLGITDLSKVEIEFIKSNFDTYKDLTHNVRLKLL